MSVLFLHMVMGHTCWILGHYSEWISGSRVIVNDSLPASQNLGSRR